MRHRGFTLIELMIVVVIIAVIAAIALPNLLSARLSSNETAAIATLRALVSAQSQFQTRAIADEDGDGTGEFGTFAELTGGVGVRGGAVLRPTVFNSSFRTINSGGEASRNGYQYRIWLPDSSANGLSEVAGGGAPAGIDSDLAEAAWACYAWPTTYESSGVKTFFVSHGGELIFCTHAAYSGPGGGPTPGAAARAGGSATSLTGSLATGTTGRDGNHWRAVQG